MHPATRLAHAGQEIDTAYGSVSPPIYQTSTFRFEEFGRSSGFEYTRIGNPTRAALESALAGLEGGAAAVATASGMAAVSTALAVFNAGAHVLCTEDCYGGTFRFMQFMAGQGKIDVSYVDLRDPQARERALRPETRAVWVETPSNPLLRVTDLAELAEFARARGLTLIADNTFLSPVLQRPLALGADMVVHSTTKYLNGHADVVGGAVIAGSEDLARRVLAAARTLGTVQAPFDSWLVLRGLRTLWLRMRAHEENARAVAQFLAGDSRVQTVNYPGLASHADHELAGRQQDGYGGMISFLPAGGMDAARRVFAAVKVFTLAESLGGVESLVGHPATMSHAALGPEHRARVGIAEHLVRLSVGIEAADDLIADLDQALGAAR